jgi:hypothetical protein
MQSKIRTPYDEFYPCEICGNDLASDCNCPKCPTCGEVGNAACIGGHAPANFWQDCVTDMCFICGAEMPGFDNLGRAAHIGLCARAWERAKRAKDSRLATRE